MDYKIIALDLDGTLTNSQKTISIRTKNALIKAQKMGIKLILASGRPMHGISPIADELNLAEYGGFVLAYNGAKIINYQTNETIYEKYLSDDIKQKVYDLSKKYGVSVNTYKKDEIIAASDNIYLQKESMINHMNIRIADNFHDDIDFHVVKYMLTGEGGHLAKIEPDVFESLKDYANVFRSEPYFLEIVPKNLDKAASLAVLLQYLDIDKSQLIAFGDGFNDRTMIEYAGLGIAMDNAQDVVKDVADYVTLSNDDDGIASALNWFVFKSQKMFA